MRSREHGRARHCIGSAVDIYDQPARHKIVINKWKLCDHNDFNER